MMGVALRGESLYPWNLVSISLPKQIEENARIVRLVELGRGNTRRVRRAVARNG